MNTDTLSTVVFLQVLFMLVKGDGFQGVNINAILNSDYLPGTLLLENALLDGHVVKPISNTSSEGQFDDAFSTMDFHRKMMNEYLCRSYLAEEILIDIIGPRVDKRAGKPSRPVSQKSSGRKAGTSAYKEGMLDDEGSMNYQNWLTRTTTLEDIYKHYGNNKAEDRDGHIPDEVGEDEFDGELTGYAMQPAQPSGFHNSYHPEPAKATGGGYGPPAPNYGAPAPSYGAPAHPPSHPPAHHDTFETYSHHEYEKDEKGMAIKDLFELALTAIAFLAFKMFLLNVIMCFVSNNNANTSNTLVSVPSTAVRNRTIRATGHHIFSQSNEISTLNDMSQRVLTNIDAVLNIQKDNGACLQRSICDNNKYSRSMNEKQRIWLPVWSLGVSYIAGRFTSGAGSDSNLVLENLRASVLGLAKSECEEIYPSCSLGKQRRGQDRMEKQTAGEI